MSRLLPLPSLMVAPTGARRTRGDHPALPVTIAQVVDTAAACHAAGAGGLHAHVRDSSGQHVLDAGLYAELMAEMAVQVPTMAVQITTEFAGRYTAAEQRALLRMLTPEGVSIALAEMLSDDDLPAARRCYHALAEAGVAVQHILYEPSHVAWLAREIAAGTVPGQGLTLLFVLGRYTSGQQSEPEMLAPFLDAMKQARLAADWALCAFGRRETACLQAAVTAGGKMRVGFENNLHMADGTLAPDNTARVREVARFLAD
ncbi:MAG: 3-keto-5-aminohexanoate cleavage protein [Rhodobacteraceae bacterium]|nr:MAG: 3-keto-5-aminohexanoate cleavage protein [Paracoccaceae bacterium]